MAANGSTTTPSVIEKDAINPVVENGDTTLSTSEKDTQSRKYLLTINNPSEKGYSHDKLKEIISGMKSVVYWCMADEIGLEEETPHTHVFLCSKNSVRFSTMRNRFPNVHIDSARGTSQQNRDYVSKTGKYADSAKHDTSVPDTFEESGILPDETRGGKNPYLKELYEMVSDGKSNFEIIDENPDYIQYIDKIDRIRLTINQEKYKDDFRKLTVVYVFGNTGLGKTRTIMEESGYSSVFRVTDYIHPFDTYKGEEVILFEEFSSSLRIQDMLNYLDGYPLKLPARYSDRQACYTKVYLTSNLPLENQYPEVQKEKPKVWDAFLRRITTVRKYVAPNQYFDHTVEEYLHGYHRTDPNETPFKQETQTTCKPGSPETKPGTAAEDYLIPNDSSYTDKTDDEILSEALGLS